MENKQIKTLLIEDSFDDAVLIKRKLENTGKSRFLVTAVQTLREGLEHVANEKPDLIISDLGLPDSHGLETVDTILKAAPQVPLVVLSGFDDENVAIKAVQSGAQDYLVKGQIENPQLERALNHSIERARLQVELEQHTREILKVQKNLHKILENNTDAILVVGEDKRIMFTNPAVESLMGRTQKELINEKFKYELDSGKTSEIKIIQPDKKKHIAEMTVVDIDWEGSPASLVSMHDITSRKQTEEDLRSSEEKYRNMVEIAQEGILTVDKLGNITSCNQAFLRIIGQNEQDIIGKNFRQLPTVNINDIPKYLLLFKSLISGKAQRPMELTWKHPDGTMRTSEFRCSLMKSNGEIIGIQAMVIDITKRKQTDNALKESEAKFSAAFRSSPDMIAIANITKGIFIEINDSYSRATGFTREEIIGHPVNEISMWVHPEESQKMTRLLQEQGKVANEEFSFRVKSGEIRQWLCSAEIINIGGDPCIISVATDITERNQMEKSIRESEEKFSKAFHSSANSFAINRLDNGKFIEVNDGFTRLTGYAKEDVIGHNANELNMWGTEETHSRITSLTRKYERVRNEQIKVRSKSGELKDGLFSSEQITLNGEPCFINTITDITELKQAEDLLRESEEKFSKAFLHSPEVIIISTVEEGMILEVNETFLRLTGYNRDELTGKKILPLGIWANPRDRTDMLKSLKEKGTVSNLEYRFRMKSGEIRTWLFSAEIIQIKGQSHMLSVTTDITERKKMEDVLRFSDIALKSIHEGVFAMDNEFKITHWNEMCEQILGVKASDVIGKPASEVIIMAEVYPGQIEKSINLLLEKGVNQEEQIYRTPHGDIWVDVHAQEMEVNGQRQGWVTLFTDISERKKTEDALRTSEEKYRELINTSTDGIVSADSQMNILIWNRGAEKIFGYTEKEMIGQSVMKIVPNINHNGMTRGYNNFTRTGSSEAADKVLDVTGIRKDGTEVPIELSISTRKADDSYIATAIIRDITFRKEAEEALKRSEEKYRELINTSNDAIVSIDSQMRFILWNQGAEKMLGYTEKEMLGLSLLTIFPQKSQKDVAKELVLLKQTGASNTINRPFETNLLKKDCSLVPVDMSISTRKSDDKIISTAIMRDITVRKEAEDKLHESQERYRDLFENATDLIQSCNQEGKFVYVNRAWREALGYSEKEVDALNLWDIIHPDLVTKCKQTLQRVMKGESVNNIETAFVTKDGKIIQVEGNVNPVRQGEKVVATRAIFRDISVRKEAEEKLKQLDQMKSEFLSNVSHELRTPLQSISGFTKLIMDGQVPDTETQQEFLQIIDRETAHLGILINGLLDMSRLEAGRFQIYRKPVLLHDTIIDSLKMFQSLARQKNINLTEEIPEEIPEMDVDAERIRQVVINLLSNAIKFSEPGTGVNVSLKTNKKELLFQVADHGTGIHEENLKHLFERFYREEGEKVRGGTGLGLYISKQIIEAHGGRIWAESIFGKGSTFSFSLPLNGKGGNNG